MFSDPVVGENFFGRQDIIDVLMKRADGLKSGYRQNVAIIGHQQLGKTSLLRQFMQLVRDPQVLAIYVEIKLQALDYFVEQFIRSLLFQYLSTTGKIDPSESLAQLTERASAPLPKTVIRIGEIMGLLKTRHPAEAYAKLFELTSILKEETGKNCIVVLDEFHRLGEFGLKNAFSDFGKRIMVQKDTMYILSSSSFSASRKILAEKLALLFGNFERIYLEPFTFQTSFEFLMKKCAPLEFPENLKHFLVSFTDGHPFFLETILSRLKESVMAKSGSVITADALAQVLMRLLYEAQGVLNQYFLKLLAPWSRANARGSHILILVALAKGRNRLKELSAAVHRNQTETSRQLKELMEDELIVKTGVFYRFHNKIFKFWLREVYEKKELSLLGAEGKADDFITGMLRTIGETDEWLKLDLTDRVLNLFSQFKDDLIEFGEKGRKLPHFTELIKNDACHDNLKGSSRSIIAKGRGRCWICKIVEEKATEREVMSLVEGSLAYQKNSPTKVLVALNGVDDNAKLLAKEKRVLTLGLSRINLLMDVYGQSPVIP